VEGREKGPTDFPPALLWGQQRTHLFILTHCQLLQQVDLGATFRPSRQETTTGWLLPGPGLGLPHINGWEPLAGVKAPGHSRPLKQETAAPSKEKSRSSSTLCWPELALLVKNGLQGPAPLSGSMDSELKDNRLIASTHTHTHTSEETDGSLHDTVPSSSASPTSSGLSLPYSSLPCLLYAPPHSGWNHCLEHLTPPPAQPPSYLKNKKTSCVHFCTQPSSYIISF
jgi:hypothetical protein